MKALLKFRAAIAEGDIDGAFVLLHRLPDQVKHSARAELARLRGNEQAARRFARPKGEGGRNAPPGVTLKSRTG